MDDLQARNDPVTLRALHECGILKFFQIPGMRAYVCLLEHMICMWDSYQQHFVVGTHTLTIDVEDIYLFIGIGNRSKWENSHQAHHR